MRNYSYIKWNEKKEVENFNKIDIGIMPLIDDEWSKGKCSYKMLQYMSCAIPVVVSPVGMNQEVLAISNIGFGAKDYYKDWINYINQLTENKQLRTEMGKRGRQVVEKYYSLDILSSRLSEVIKLIIK